MSPIPPLLILAALALYALFPRRKPLNQSSDYGTEGGEPFLSDEVRRALNPDLCTFRCCRGRHGGGGTR